MFIHNPEIRTCLITASLAALMSAGPAQADLGDRFSDLLSRKAKETVSDVVAQQAAQAADRVLQKTSNKVLGEPQAPSYSEDPQNSVEVYEEVKVTYDEDPESP